MQIIRRLQHDHLKHVCQEKIGADSAQLSVSPGGDLQLFCLAVRVPRMCIDIGIVTCGPNEALVISGMFQVSPGRSPEQLHTCVLRETSDRCGVGRVMEGGKLTKQSWRIVGRNGFKLLTIEQQVFQSIAIYTIV